MAKRRVLVTGGAGFVGASLVRLLIAEGYQVTVLDDLTAGNRQHIDGLPIEFIHGSVLDVPLVNGLATRFDGIAHLAAQTGIPNSIADPRRDLAVNVTGTLNLLDTLRNAGDAGRAIRFVFASSNAALGRQTPPSREDKAPLPVSPYGASKLAAEAYCLAYQASWGLQTVVLRFGNVYGPFSGHKTSVVARFFLDMLDRNPITVYGDGQQSRDFIYAEDIARAILAALESDVTGEVFQIATGMETRIIDLATMVRETVGLDVTVQHQAARQADVAKSFSAVTKARDVLGWTPQVELAEGLRRSWTWFRSQHEGVGTLPGPASGQA